MRLLLDSADRYDIKSRIDCGFIVGVTTNPTLVSKADADLDFKTYEEYVDVLLDAVPPNMHLSVEVTTLDPREMFAQAMRFKELARWDARKYTFHVKVPVLPQTMWVIKALSDQRVQVNATACFTAMQAKLAADAGAHVVSFFYNRMADQWACHGGHEHGHSCTSQGTALRYARDEIEKFLKSDFGARVICGSIRTAQDVLDLWGLGVNYVTCSGKILDELLTHPGTTKSVEGFQKDIDQWLASRKGP